MKRRVIVIVGGGNVQNCFADDGDIEVEVIDFDNIEEEGAEQVKAATDRVDEIAKTMHHVY